MTGMTGIQTQTHNTLVPVLYHYQSSKSLQILLLMHILQSYRCTSMK